MDCVLGEDIAGKGAEADVVEVFVQRRRGSKNQGVSLDIYDQKIGGQLGLAPERWADALPRAGDWPTAGDGWPWLRRWLRRWGPHVSQALIFTSHYYP